MNYWPHTPSQAEGTALVQLGVNRNNERDPRMQSTPENLESAKESRPRMILWLDEDEAFLSVIARPIRRKHG